MPEPISRQIRPTRQRDFARVLELYALARETMRRSGNFAQWAGGYPDEAALQRDLQRKVSYVIEQEGRIVGTFAFIPGIEPTYRRIWGGHWLDEKTLYGTIHRLAGDPACSGIFQTCLDWCWERLPNIRIDTHRDNRIMQHLLQESGFRYCGIIYLLDGAERLAYQRVTDVERLRKDAKLILPARTRALAERYGYTVNKIFIKHNRSNWGSCSALGNLNLNLNLVRLSPEVRDYVILHELCHLRYLNHGAQFHALLESLCVEQWGAQIPDRPLHEALRRRLRGYYLV